eukprot:23811_1
MKEANGNLAEALKLLAKKSVDEGQGNNLNNTRELQQYRAEIRSLKSQVSAAKNEVFKLLDEKKEMEILICKLKEENNELKKKNINTSAFLSWKHEEILLWILSIDDGFFDKYSKQDVSTAYNILAELYDECYWDLKIYHKLNSLVNKKCEFEQFYVNNKSYKMDSKILMSVNFISKTDLGKLLNMNILRIIVYFCIECIPNRQILEQYRLEYWQNKMNDLRKKIPTQMLNELAQYEWK